MKFMPSPSRTCPVCGISRSGKANHSQCSKELQIKMKRVEKPRKGSTYSRGRDLDYFAGL